MANIKSAKKRVLVIEKKSLQNKSTKSALKTATKKFEAAVASGDVNAAKEAYTVLVKKTDQACAKNIFKKNTTARKKSKYTRMLNSMTK